ncbi:hypothetical protein EST38_g6413 [Candolleomyces aberdarensis]|uniref:Piwi domain-containing protein n=1 Tax=Candolleomyces aberdarensis TaxID=2316362 RepID=A0A4Q2DKP0_9AGAR|nr:hypothetical protein EST38_g6413 [Candolleomyces aberdarensis]
MAKGVYAITLKLTSQDALIANEIGKSSLKRKPDSPEYIVVINFLQLLIRQKTNNISEDEQKKVYLIGENGAQPLVRTPFELRRGISHSVRPAVGRVTVVVDTTAAAFYQPISLIDALLRHFNLREARDLQRLSKAQVKEASKIFKNVIIERGDGSGRRRKMIGFNQQGAFFEFENGEGMKITIAEHYRRTYNINLRYPAAPGVVLKEPPKSQWEIVPIELWKICPGQVYKKSLTEAATREMVKFSSLIPEQKKQEVLKAAQRYQNCEALNDAGMVVSSRLIDVKATLLTTPRIEFSNGSKDVIENFMAAVIRKVAPKVKQDAGEDEKQAALKAGKEAVDRGLDNNQFFILVILPMFAAETKAALKYWCDVKFGIITQCIRVNKIRDLAPGSNGENQYYNNAVLKVNARLLGENFKPSGSLVFDNLLGDRVPRGALTLIIGADIGHPSPGVKKPSVASLVYNQDRYGIKYNATSTIQMPRQEVIGNIKKMFNEAIVALMTRERKAVSNIIFFRDGVSEGEYAEIAKTEITAIEEEIGRIWTNSQKIKQLGSPRPKLTFVVVGKRHRTVLFPAVPRGNLDDGKGNCKAGVVIDEGINQPHITDFYLQSHSAIKGTSRSSHYIVLKDEVFNGKTKELQDLAFSLCHIYARATRSVSIPAPVYYADLACRRDSFHYRPGAENKLLSSDAGSVVSSGSGKKAPFKIEDWEKEFDTRHGRLTNSMYFL